MFFKQKAREYLAKKLGLPEIPASLERLAKIGFKPDRIFDVGAYQGDFAVECLKHFPNSKVCCFEVLGHKIDQLNRLASKNPAIQIFPTLLGAEIQANVPFNQAETASSILVEHIDQNFPVKSYPMTTVDFVVSDRFHGKSPDFLKLDVQGYELEVLKGAEKSLQNIQVILAEVNLLDIHQNVPLLAEIIEWLNCRDWVAYDICGLTRRPLDRALWQADFMFVPRHSELRKNKHWAE